MMDQGWKVFECIDPSSWVYSCSWLVSVGISCIYYIVGICTYMYMVYSSACTHQSCEIYMNQWGGYVIIGIRYYIHDNCMHALIYTINYNAMSTIECIVKVMVQLTREHHDRYNVNVMLGT